MSELETRNVRGSLLDLGLDQGADSFEIGLNLGIVLYKDEFQIVGDVRVVYVDQDGNWNVDLVDTDNMEEESYYVFNIRGRLYHRRLVPLSAPDWRFRDLPVFEC